MIGYGKIDINNWRTAMIAQLALLTLISLNLFGASNSPMPQDKATVLYTTFRTKLKETWKLNDDSRISEFKTLITDGLDVNSIDEYGNALLCHTIAPIPAPEITAFLLSAGAQLPTHVQDSYKLLVGQNHFTDQEPTMTLLEFAFLRVRTTGMGKLDACSCIRLLYEAGIPDTLDAVTQKHCDLIDTWAIPKDIEDMTKAKVSGIARKGARQTNREIQLACLQTALDNSHLINDLLLIIRDYVGLQYTAQDNVQLTLIDGPASC